MYERPWGEGDHPAKRQLTKEEFHNLLDELGLAAWHGEGRTVTETALVEACVRAGLSEQLERFKEGAKAGAIGLLAAFYFRQAGQIPGGERTFEFTHKSFGEYLVARRIVRWIEDIHEERARNRSNRQRGWSEEEALIKWIEVTGPATLDFNLLVFLEQEVALRGGEALAAWQKTLAELFSDELHQGLPMHKIGLSTYREMNWQARNAEEFLLAAHFCCASANKQLSSIRWPYVGALRDLLGRSHCSAREYLGWLEAHDGNNAHQLSWMDLVLANLEGTNLEGAYVYGANPEEANLARAKLYETNLTRVNLRGAKLMGTKLQRAYLQDANLEGANLEHADLEQAYLQNANLRDANLVGVQGLDKARQLREVRSWRGTKIERKWVERLGLDAEKLGLVVVDNLDDD